MNFLHAGHQNDNHGNVQRQRHDDRTIDNRYPSKPANGVLSGSQHSTLSSMNTMSQFLIGSKQACDQIIFPDD